MSTRDIQRQDQLARHRRRNIELFTKASAISKKDETLENIKLEQTWLTNDILIDLLEALYV